jgi:large subunit ribosomal protein L19e
MQMQLQKRLAGKILGCSPKRIKLDPEKLAEIKEAITKFDVRRLLNKGVITVVPVQGISQFRTRAARGQKRRSRQTGHGSRKGTANARADDKMQWMRSVRAQRELLKRLRDNQYISQETFNSMYMKSKGGYFRSIHHLKLYLQEQELFLKGKK